MGIHWEDIIFGFVLGMTTGALVFIGIQTDAYNLGVYIQTSDIKQKIADCQQKDYYYIDSHRVICDTLGVSPK